MSPPSLRIVCYRLDIPGGLERSLAALVAVLQGSFDVEIVLLRGRIAPVLRHDLAGVRVRFMRCNPLRIAWASATQRTDAVVIAGLWAALFWPRTWSKWGRAGRVLWEHSLVPTRLPNDRRLRSIERLIWRVCRNVATVVSVSPSAADYVRAELAARAGEADMPLVVVIPNVIRTGARTGTVPASGTGGAGLRLLSMHRLSPLKNTDLSLEAMTHLPKDVTLTCLGDGPERPRLERRLRELSLQDRVSMPGFLSDVEPFLSASDMVLHPSLAETSCIAAVEAAEAGLPFVCLDVGGLSTTVPRQVVGVCIPPSAGPRDFAEAILRARVLIGDRSLFDAARRIREEELAPEAIVRRWRSVLAPRSARDRSKDVDHAGG